MLNLMENIVIDVSVTGLCDMNCPFCYGAEKPISNKPVCNYMAYDKKIYPELSFDELKKILLKLKKIGIKVLNIGGGEPLVRKDTSKIVKYAKELDYKIYLSTNGTLFLKQYKCFKNNLDIVGFSLDGPDVKTNMLMGRNSYVFDNVDKILKFLYKNPPKFKVKIGTLVSKVNYDKIIKIGNYLYNSKKQYKPDVWRIFQFEALRKGKLTRKEYEISDYKFNQLISKLKKIFPNVNISSRSNKDHNNAYFWVTPYGMLQVINKKHINILDLKTANLLQIKKSIMEYKLNFNKIQSNRNWMNN